jgi:hypothetical protein
MLTALQADLFAPDVPPSVDDETTHDHPAVMYHCRHCEQQTRRPHVWRQTFTRTTRARTWTVPSTGRTERFTELAWTDDRGQTTIGSQPPASPCRTCRRPTAGRTVEGTYSPTRRCDDRCLYARGHVCECSCGGRNHGRGCA